MGQQNVVGQSSITLNGGRRVQQEGGGRRAPRGAPTLSNEPRKGSVVAVAAIITVAFAGSALVTPLYTLYQRKFGFSEIG